MKIINSYLTLLYFWALYIINISCSKKFNNNASTKNLINNKSKFTFELSNIQLKDEENEIKIKKVNSNNSILGHNVSVLFLSGNEESEQINELKLFRVNISDSYTEFINNNYKIKIPLNNILFINQNIYFKVKEIETMIDDYYKNKFLSVLEKLNLHSKTNPYISENGYVILTSNKMKINNKSHSYTTHNAIVFVPSQKDITNNPGMNVIPILEKISEKFSKLITSPDHIIEQQSFDSSYKFEFIWKTEINHHNSIKTNKGDVFVSLNKEGVYISNDKKSNNLNSFIQAARYDQYTNCQANKFINKTFFLNSNDGLVKVNDLRCCIEYDVNWYEKPYKEMFCSKLDNKNLCLIEINYFKHFMFRKCMEKGIESLVREFSNDYPSFKMKMSYLNKISMYSLIINLKTMEKLNLLKSFKKQLFKSDEDYESIKNNLDNLFIKSLQSVNDIDIDNILRYGNAVPSEVYFTNKYIKKKSEELKKGKGFLLIKRED